MKLFTKDIDQKLFDQYMMGNDLENQMVVAKIFNPYGNGVWYLLNSDPSDPDYLWAIVDLFEVEVGSVSREELETLKVPPFRLGLERDLYFTPMNAKKLYEALLSGEKFEDGGTIDIKKDKSGESWVFPNNPQGETYGIKLAAGGMTAGRYYKDSSGQELRYIGESQGKLLFKDGEKVVYKQESDFEEAPQEKRRFGFFEHGGKTQSKRYKVNVYYGGEMEDEEFYTDSLDEAERASQGGEHSEIYDNHKKEFVETEYSKGGTVKYYDKDNEYKIGRPSGYIEKEILERVSHNEEEFVGSFGWKTSMGKMAEGYLYNLNDFDRNLVNDIKLKQGEKILRYLNRTTAIGGMRPFIKINVDKALLYFLVNLEDDGIEFETKGIQANYVALIASKMNVDSYMAKGGELDKTILKYIYKRYDIYKDGKNQESYSDFNDSVKVRNHIEQSTGLKVLEIKELEIGKNYPDNFSNPYYYDTYEVKLSKGKPFVVERMYGKPRWTGNVAYTNGIDVKDLYKMAKGGGVGFTPYGETKGIYKVYYKADGKPQTEIWETKEMAVNTAKRYSSPQMAEEFSNVKVFDEDGAEVDYMSEAKYEDGGEMDDEGVDLFEDYDDIPENVQKVLDKHSDAFENEDYKGLEKAKKDLEKIGYTFEYGLDGTAYDLRKIGQKGKSGEEYAKGGMTKFKEKVQSIKASLLKRKKVSPKVQKDYGKTYSPKEAEDSAKRIVGSMVKKEKRQPRVSKMLEKMKKGTQLNKKKSTFKDRMKDLSIKIKERKSKSTK